MPKQTKVTREFVPAAFSGYGAGDVEVIREALLAIDAAEDGVRVASVLAHARKKRHPLHRFLTWDDRSAAEKFRLNEVRRLCRAVRVRYIDGDGKTLANLPMLVSILEVSEEDGEKVLQARRYLQHELAMADEVSREELVAEALRQLSAWQTRYNALTELQPVFDAFARIEKRARNKRAG